MTDKQLSFDSFLNELTVPNTPEVISVVDKQEARRIVGLTRSLRPGRLGDLSNQENTQGTKSTVAVPASGSNQDGLSLIIKNDSKEVVYVDKSDDGFLLITYINKQRFSKRTVTLEARGALLLKRFI